MQYDKLTFGARFLTIAPALWVICAGCGYVTGESVKAINLIFAWQVLEFGTCPLRATKYNLYSTNLLRPISFNF